ncbi:hypothetical protein OH491_26635 [Termitidicoccus mucosus]|uniref:hypothetical protein n=1 Tax=Termitidicoccus mucosus TaxID=1184151 RepID=UPI0011AB453A
MSPIDRKGLPRATKFTRQPSCRCPILVKTTGTNRFGHHDILDGDSGGAGVDEGDVPIADGTSAESSNRSSSLEIFSGAS